MNFTNCTVADISKALGLTTSRVQQLVKSNILPKPINGNYDLTECIRAYEQYLQQQNPNKNNNNLHIQKLRLLKAQADKAELSIKAEKALISLIGTITYTILQLTIKIVDLV